MFSFVDLRLALLLSAAVLLVRAQGEDDRKFLHCLLDLPDFLSFCASWVLKADLLSLLGWMAAEILAKKKFEVGVETLMCAPLLSSEKMITT